MDNKSSIDNGDIQYSGVDPFYCRIVVTLVISVVVGWIIYPFLVRLLTPSALPPDIYTYTSESSGRRLAYSLLIASSAGLSMAVQPAKLRFIISLGGLFLWAGLLKLEFHQNALSITYREAFRRKLESAAGGLRSDSLNSLLIEPRITTPLIIVALLILAVVVTKILNHRAGRQARLRT